MTAASPAMTRSVRAARSLRRVAPILATAAACATPSSQRAPAAPRASQANGAPVATQTTRGRRALRIEDYYRVPRVLSPQISPNGGWVVYTVAMPTEASNTDAIQTWIVRTDGSGRRRVTHQGLDVFAASWRADGRLAYQVGEGLYALDPERRNAEPINQHNQVRGVVSPDGQWIATAVRLPMRPAQKPGNDTPFERRHDERFRGLQFDWLNYKRDGAEVPAPDPRDPQQTPSAEILIAPVGDGEALQLTSLGLRPTGLSWTPDGSGVVFTVDQGFRQETTYSRADVWVAELDGTIRRLTRDAYVYSQLSFSPNGQLLAFTRTFGLDTIIDQQLDNGGPRDIIVMQWPSGEYLNVTFDFDRDPSEILWSADSRSIYFLAEDGGERQLFRVPVTGGFIDPITTGPRRIDNVTFDQAARLMAYTSTSYDSPPEVYVANTDGTGERQVSDVYEDVLSDIAFTQAERIKFTSPDSTSVEGWLLFPYGYSPDAGPYPLIVENHGGPHFAIGYDFDFRQQLLAANGYFVLEVNFRGSTGYGDDFKYATWGAWGTKDGADVIAALDHVMERYPIDRSRIGVTGHSYGGFLTNWLITQYPSRFAAAVSSAGISNWISDYGLADISFTKETEFFGPPWDPRARDIMIRQSPLFYADRVRTPTLFIHGENDYRVPFAESEQFYFALRKNDVPARMLVYAGQSHNIEGHWNQVHRMIQELRWWEQYLVADNRGPR